MTKTLSKLGTERTYLKAMKAICENLVTNVILNGEKLKSFSSKIWNRARVPILATSIQHSTGSPRHGNQRRKRNKRNTNWKRRSKTVAVCR